MKKTIFALSLLGLAFVGGSAWAQDPALDQSNPVLLAQAPTLEQNEQNQGGESIGDEDTQAKSPYMATMFSVLPGVIFHGMGNFYAEDYDFGTEMLVMEILGAGVSIWGYNVIHEPSHWNAYFGHDSQQAGYWIKAVGVGMLSISWVGDVATAPGAAEQWNKDHQLELQMDSFNATGVRLTASLNY